MATAKELATRFGMTTEVLFANGYARYGLIYGIGPPKVAHAEYLRTGNIPAYVRRYCQDLERLEQRDVQLELPL